MGEHFVLGIWDGHDAGAALLRGGEIVFAINEERLSRRKLEVGFPQRSIMACLDFAGLDPSRIEAVSASTTDPAKTLTRLVPRLKEEYYLIRRRKMAPRPFDAFKKAFKYRFTELAPNVISRRLSLSWLRERMRSLGFDGGRLELVDHHSAHAAAAAFCCGFPACLVMTLDGVGDGCCGSLWSFKEEKLSLLKTLPASRSLGIFFEHVTNLMNMRELEDEGKVMALANYAYPIEDHENPLLSIIRTEGLDIVTPYSSTAMFQEMKKIIWRYPSEQFAAMAQRVLEKCVLDLAAEALKETGHSRIAAAGGVFSNIKMNMKIAGRKDVEGIYIFPHMGDGGLAIGAAMLMNYGRYAVSRYALPSLALGPSFTTEEVLSALEHSLPTLHVAQHVAQGFSPAPLPAVAQRFSAANTEQAALKGCATNRNQNSVAQRFSAESTEQAALKGCATDSGMNSVAQDFSPVPTVPKGCATETDVTGISALPGFSPATPGRRGDLSFSRIPHPAETAARLILGGEIILWFQGRMEIGPRSLGNRSILARPDDRSTKDRLNLLLKKRVWYQPFCPSMLSEDAPSLLVTEGQNISDNRFMTMAFQVREERLKIMEGVINIDGTCRPQFVGDEHPAYRELLVCIKKAIGYGVVLNTSFNIHGEPVVCSPGEAIDMQKRAGIRYLVMEDVLVDNLAARKTPAPRRQA